MPARCPECDQTGPVSPAQLQLEGGLIACRHCGALFDALPRIVRQAPEGWPLAPGCSATTTRLSAAPPPALADEAWPTHTGERRRAGNRRLIVLLGAMLTLLLLFASAFRPQPAQLPGAALLAEARCRAGARIGLPCGAPVDFDPAALDLRSHRLIRAAGDAGELAFIARLINRGASAQPLPVIELTLEDRAGIALARERFGPHQYLAAPTAMPSGAAWLPPAGELAVHLPLQTPTHRVAGYRFVLWPPTEVGAGGEAD